QIAIVLKDNGGTPNGGNDTSAPQTLTISVTKPRPWHNTIKGLDVTNDGHVVAVDALVVINYANSFGSGLVPANAVIGQPFGFLDTDGDNHVSPVDALIVINTVNAGLGGEGEGSQGTGDRRQETGSDLIMLLAQDIVEQAQSQ